MTQQLIRLMLEGISVSMQTDGAMITIIMSKGIFKAHHFFPVHNAEQSSLQLQSAILDCKDKLQHEMDSVRKWPDMSELPTNIQIGKGIVSTGKKV